MFLENSHTDGSSFGGLPYLQCISFVASEGFLRIDCHAESDQPLRVIAGPIDRHVVWPASLTWGLVADVWLGRSATNTGALKVCVAYLNDNRPLVPLRRRSVPLPLYWQHF